MPDPCGPFDGGGVEAVDGEFLADFLKHAQLNFLERAIRRSDVTGEGIGGFIQAFGQGIADQAEQGVEAIFFFKQVKNGLGDNADAVGVIGREDRHVIDHALNGNEFGGAHLLIGGGNGDHDGDESVLFGQRSGDGGHEGSFVGVQIIDGRGMGQ